MQRIRSVSAACCALVLSACLSAPEADSSRERSVASQSAALTSDEPKPGSAYYTLRRDQRRCASPVCGGYWVSLVNRDDTTCADGSQAQECYVAELVLPAGVSLDGSELVHGELNLRSYPAPQTELGVITVDAVLRPVIVQTARPRLYALAYDTGIRCITAPCPSLALVSLNTDERGSIENPSFVAADSSRRAALEEAFYAELRAPSSIGTGAIVLGRTRVVFDRRERITRLEFAVSNVYVTTPGPSPVCLVHTELARATAWNFASAAAAEDLAAGLPGRVDIAEGRCSELWLACSSEYVPVRGRIDALGEVCVDFWNACEFRSAVIQAAGTQSKASGDWTSGQCDEPSQVCELDADCEDGYCGWDASGGRMCRAWAVEGERCEGFVLPEARRFCDPRLECRLLEPTGDAGGVCLLPGSTFSCGDQGWTCSYERDYCQAIVGGVPNPETGAAVISYSCASEPECSGPEASCACLESHGHVAGGSCDDNGLLPPTVTLFAP